MTLTAHYQGPLPDNGEGCFGAVAPFWCEDCECGIWSADLRCLSRQTLWEPADYAYQCPNCGRLNVNEVTSTKRAPMKATRRYTIQRHKQQLAA